ncbi:hypothetical protein KDL01_24625 [Actinospica durhamensis]|uniref:Uncharacterized protein n=1 Tax=Actinospica durhamensis TaxID=1508375 RepID=A0A941IV59_9ACTN|nr:hypothetical protein [Actinospica durhamensis]MBR7836486.1 hypothetical protein [Actinospica durhamensis]
MLTAAAAVVGSGLAPAASAATPSPAVSAAALPAPGLSSTDHTSCAPSGEGGTTCTNTYGGDTAWDWSANGGSGGMTGETPTVTVDQTVNLTNQIVHVSWNNFTPSMNGNFEGGYQQGSEFYPVAVFQCAGTNPVASFPNMNCNNLMVGTPTSGAAATGVESYTLSGTSTNPTDCLGVQPADTVCGTGYTDIQVQTKVQNSTLGCDQTHACSIVVLPVWGGDYSTPDCEDHSSDYQDASWAEDVFEPWQRVCAWNDAMVVPITFAPVPATYCPASAYSFTAAGSAMLEKAMGQWQPSWCQSGTGTDQVDFDYNSGVSEYQARQQFLSASQSVTGSVDAALVTDPASSALTAGSSRKFTYAPIATSSISIAYYIDDNTTQEPVTDIKLDARLLAKLLTQSYSLQFGTCPAGQVKESATCDPAVSGNPRTIFEDPEFYQLNPEYTEDDFKFTGNDAADGQFLPIVVAGESDMTWELTRWIASDPDALAFLEGKPDQWGMHVNTDYEKFAYPLSSFVEQDPGWTDSKGMNEPYYKTMQESWNPVTGVDNVAADLAGWQSSDFQFYGLCQNGATVSEPPCANGIQPNNPREPVENFPDRALFAVMDSGTAAAFRFPTAELVNPAGNAEGPTTDAMSAAVSAMKTNPDGVTQYQDYDATSPTAYPLTEVQYAMVPTCGLSSAKAAAIADFLTDVTDSQTYGVSLGQLPPWGGYLALSSAQQRKTLAAAAAVRAQNCKTVNPDTTVSGKKPTGGGGGGSTGPTGGGSGPGTSPSTAAAPSASASAAASSAASASASATPAPVGFGYKAADTSSDVGVILPTALAAGGLLAIGGPLAYAFGTGSLRRPRFSAPWRGADGSAAAGGAPDPEAQPQPPSQGPDGGGLDG